MTYILSLLDLVATMYLTAMFQGREIEANPFGRFMLDISISATIYKVVVVACALYLLWYYREHKLARIAKWIVFGAFSTLMIYHCVCLGMCHKIMFCKY